MVWAVVAGVAILVLSASGQRAVSAWPWLLTAATLVVVVAVPCLLPVGTWTFAPGLPSRSAAHWLVGAAFLGAESYLPLALIEFRDLAPAPAGDFMSVISLSLVVAAVVVVWLTRLGFAQKSKSAMKN